jgi:hypothetical protein
MRLSATDSTCEKRESTESGFSDSKKLSNWMEPSKDIDKQEWRYFVPQPSEDWDSAYATTRAWRNVVFLHVIDGELFTGGADESNSELPCALCRSDFSLDWEFEWHELVCSKRLNSWGETYVPYLNQVRVEKEDEERNGRDSIVGDLVEFGESWEMGIVERQAQQAHEREWPSTVPDPSGWSLGVEDELTVTGDFAS